MILGICDVAEVLKVLRIVKLVILIIQIAVPILLIISFMTTFLANVNDANVSKSLKSSYNKIIAAVIIFLVPYFVNLMVHLISPGDDGYAACLDNATPEGINLAFELSARQAIDNAKKSLKEYDYNIAKNVINEIRDEYLRDSLLRELEDVEVYMKINDILSSLEINFNRELYKRILNDINNVTDQNQKNKLLERYNNIYHYEKTNVVSEGNLKYHINGYTGLKYYLYNQCEGDWANISLSRGKSTFCGIGCGLTTCTVIISSYNSNVRPRDAARFGDDYNHDKVIEKQTKNNYKCKKYGENKITKEEIISALEKGNVASIKVWGRNNGGSSKFTSSQHFMALIDYYDGQIFVGNAYGNNSYGKYGWYKASEVLTSIKSTVICEPSDELIKNN